jgi:hypothetical protein
VVDGVSVADAAQPRDAAEERHREPAVDEPVVDGDVGDPEDRHPDAGPEGDRGGRSVQIASDHDERRGGRRVAHREGVVELEAPAAPRVVRAMHAPHGPVPDAPVEEPRPGLHHSGHDAPHERGERDERERAHVVAP